QKNSTMLGESRRLIIAPHYDDEVLGCGGLLSRCPDGSAVLFMCGRTYTHSKDYREDCRSTKQAYVHACKVKDLLGYEHVFHAAFDDELLHRYFNDAVERIEFALNAWRPDLVLIPSIGDLNQDHKTTAHAAMIACRGYAVASYFVPS